MKNYQEIDLTKPIEELRENLEKDYKKIVIRYRLPKSLSFDAVKKAVYKGMVPKKDYPFAVLQKEFLSHLSRTDIHDEEFNLAFQVFVAMWNCFPQQDLGSSPLEKMREEAEARGENDLNIENVFDEKKYIKLVDEHILYLSKMGKNMLAEQLKKFGGTQKDVTTIVSILENPQTSPDAALEYLLLSFIKKTKQTTNRTIVEEIQPVVRALAFCESHISSKMSTGHYNSRMFQHVAEKVMLGMAESMEKGGRIIHPLEVLENLADTHASIHSVGEKIGARPEVIASAHHILDWIMYADALEILSKTPLQMALIMIEGACLISNTADPKFDTGCSVKDIRDEIGVKDKNTTHDKEVRRLLKIAICECSDPYMMVPNLYDKDPDTCVTRLSDIAPCISLRSPDEFLPDSFRL